MTTAPKDAASKTAEEIVQRCFHAGQPARTRRELGDAIATALRAAEQGRGAAYKFFHWVRSAPFNVAGSEVTGIHAFDSLPCPVCDNSAPSPAQPEGSPRGSGEKCAYRYPGEMGHVCGNLRDEHDPLYAGGSHHFVSPKTGGS